MNSISCGQYDMAQMNAIKIILNFQIWRSYKLSKWTLYELKIRVVNSKKSVKSVTDNAKFTLKLPHFQCDTTDDAYQSTFIRSHSVQNNTAIKYTIFQLFIYLKIRRPVPGFTPAMTSSLESKKSNFIGIFIELTVIDKIKLPSMSPFWCWCECVYYSQDFLSPESDEKTNIAEPLGMDHIWLQ